jgi:hypothetical protein
MGSRVGQIGKHRAAASDSVREPCVTCGEETAAGSVFFSDRLKVTMSDGKDAFLCSLCNERIRSSNRKRRMTDEEVAEFIRNGNAAGLTWAIRY